MSNTWEVTLPRFRETHSMFSLDEVLDFFGTNCDPRRVGLFLFLTPHWSVWRSSSRGNGSNFSVRFFLTLALENPPQEPQAQRGLQHPQSWVLLPPLQHRDQYRGWCPIPPQTQQPSQAQQLQALLVQRLVLKFEKKSDIESQPTTLTLKFLNTTNICKPVSIDLRSSCSKVASGHQQ